MSIERELLKRFMTELKTEEDVVSLFNDIKECLAKSEQEPEAWIIVNKETGYRTQVSDLTPFLYHREIFEVIPLYTAPPKREPLSDKEITKNTPKLIHIGERLAFHAGVRFSERHHIIGVNDDT